MHTAFIVIVLTAAGLTALNLYLALFGPDLRYHFEDPPEGPLDSDYFQRLLSTLTQSEIAGGNRIQILRNGENFYAAELAEIRRAERTINLEAYIFHPGNIGIQFVEALAERARAGVRVKLTLDYIGCFRTPRSYFRPLEEAGGQMKWYHSLRPDLLPQLNNRTHRELMIIDGRVAFIGGAGVADQWYTGEGKGARWRDTVLRVEGPAVPSLQSVFAQNWLRVSGEILSGSEYFQFGNTSGGSSALVVGSTPAAGATPARVLFQTLIASADKQIYISTPYFLPDRGAQTAIIQAARERGVQVKILTPGKRSDQMMTRASSRELYGALLKHGVAIHEYEPAMIHVKAMMIDRCWAVIGSTNFDYRSFNLNDEVNLAVLDEDLTQQLVQDFEADLNQSRCITYEIWRRKMRFRLADRLMTILERQE